MVESDTRLQRIIAAATHQRIGIFTTIQQIVTFATEERVISFIAIGGIVSALPLIGIIARKQGDRIVLFGPDQIIVVNGCGHGHSPKQAEPTLAGQSVLPDSQGTTIEPIRTIYSKRRIMFK
jgi:hypothetical protein